MLNTNKMKFSVQVKIRLKSGMLNPEAAMIKRALGNLNYKNVAEVNTAKIITLVIDAISSEDAVSSVDDMCSKLLANPVIEEYEIIID